MTRKDYVYMAQAISEMTIESQKNIVAKTFAEVAQKDNQNFDKERFFKACGLNP